MRRLSLTLGCAAYVGGILLTTAGHPIIEVLLCYILGTLWYVLAKLEEAPRG